MTPGLQIHEIQSFVQRGHGDHESAGVHLQNDTFRNGIPPERTRPTSCQLRYIMWISHIAEAHVNQKGP